MKIKQLQLKSNNLAKQLEFYTDVFELKPTFVSSKKLSFDIGHTQLTFEKSAIDYTYHYCFLIPSNQLQNALIWLKQRTSLIQINDDQYIQYFEDWNAHSIYFYDGNGNIAEFIVRHDLQNDILDDFNANQIIGVNEIGLPTYDIDRTNQKLQTKLKTKFWKGNVERFGTNGNLDGLFLLVNPAIKKTWFPTEQQIQFAPFDAKIQQDKITYQFSYVKGDFITQII